MSYLDEYMVYNAMAVECETEAYERLKVTFTPTVKSGPKKKVRMVSLTHCLCRKVAHIAQRKARRINRR